MTDDYRTIVRRFTRRRLLTVAATYPGSLAFLVLGGDFSQRQAIAQGSLLLIFVIAAVVLWTRYLAHWFRPLREGIAHGCDDPSEAIARMLQLRRLTKTIVPLWLIIFVVTATAVSIGGNALAGTPLFANAGMCLLAVLLCGSMYIMLSMLIVEDAIAETNALFASRANVEQPPSAVTLGGIRGRIAAVIILTLAFVTAMLGTAAVHISAQIAAGSLNAADAGGAVWRAIGVTTFLAFFYGILAARFLTNAIAAALLQVSASMDRVRDGDLSALADVKRQPRPPHEAGALLDSLAAANDNIERVANASTALAAGNLAITIRPRSSGDFLGIAMQRLIESVRRVLLDARGAAGTLDAGSTQVSASATQLSALASQIAHELSQTSAAMDTLERSITAVESGTSDVRRAVADVGASADALEGSARSNAAGLEELARTMERNAAVANDVRGLAAGTQTVATGAARAVHDAGASSVAAAETMNEVVRVIGTLASASERIGLITDTIDDISDQTNLLALNAAIEAARAGEHGRGFAVVADEIRKLAERSTIATKEIASLIREVQAETSRAVEVTRSGNTAVETGRERATAAQAALDAIVRDVGDIAQQLTLVVGAHSEQQAATESLVLGTVEVEAQTTRTRDVARRLDAVAHSLAQAAGEGARAVNQATGTVTALVGNGAAVASAASDIAALTAALRASAEALTAAIRHFHDAPPAVAPQRETAALREK